MEEWREIPGTDGFIEVSNKGRVRSRLKGEPYVLKTNRDKKGYRRLRVTVHREKMAFIVHREVARAFIPNPYNLPQVNHKDGNKENNTVENLEWCTNQQNALHAVKNGLWDSVFAAAMIRNEAIKRPVIAIKGNERLYFGSIREAERAIGSRHITDVLKGKREHANGYTFFYAEKGVMPNAADNSH